MSKLEDVALRIAEKQMGDDQAKAINSGHDVMLVIDGYMPWAREIACVAIEAMRKPTPEILQHLQMNTEIGSYITENWSGAYECMEAYQSAMIDAVLKETAP